MDIIIGRQGNQPFPLTEPSISKRHASFHLDEATGKMTLRDEHSTNGTYIKMKDGTFRRLYGEVVVGPGTMVRLGAKQVFMINELVKKTAPPPPQAVDISHLRGIYETYNAQRMRLEAQQSSIMMLRIGSMSLSAVVVNVLAEVLIPKDSLTSVSNAVVRLIGTILAVGISWLLVDMKSKGLIRKRNQNDRYFKKNYCCPKCGYHFGPRIYENILAEGRCPNSNCKCKFTGK